MSLSSDLTLGYYKSKDKKTWVVALGAVLIQFSDNIITRVLSYANKRTLRRNTDKSRKKITF